MAEFYEVAPGLARDLRTARAESWGAIAAMTLGLGGVLYGIVLGGSRTIEAQRRALDARLADLRNLSARNHELRLRVQAAAARAAAQSDRTMRSLGADLHDGPAQQLAFAALRLDALRGRSEDEDLACVHRAVTDAMAELRALSCGLQLPDIADRLLAAIVDGVVQAHEARTGHLVDLRIDCAADPPLGPAARVCLYRFGQEGLTNGSRHAGGCGLEVELACAPGEVRLAVRNRGPGLPPNPAGAGGLGLAGLRGRVESLGGVFLAQARPGGGAEIVMTLDTGGPV